MKNMNTVCDLSALPILWPKGKETDQGMVSLAKGTLWGNCKFAGGMRAIAFIASVGLNPV